MNDSINRENFWKNIKSDYYKTNSKHGIEQREFLAKVLINNNVNSILEIGCNSGGNLMHIHKLSSTIKLTGIDICEEAIKYGKEVEKIQLKC